MLLSGEYLELVNRRLRDDGVFVIYAREGDGNQERLIERTMTSVFDHVRRVGVILIASRSPLPSTRADVFTRARDASTADDPFFQNLRSICESNRAFCYELSDWHVVRAEDTDVPIITDDRPLVEYPGVLRKLLGPNR